MDGKPGYQEFSLVAANFQCNGCWAKFGSRDQGAATACRHLYCISCIQEIVQSDDSSCPICSKPISKTNAKAVKTMLEGSDFQLTLAGQTPEVIMKAAEAAMDFYLEQQNLYKEYQRIQLGRKQDKQKQLFKDKFGQLQAAFSAAKRKLGESEAGRKTLAAENEELLSKYSQKAQQAQRLKEQASALSQEIAQMKHQAGQGFLSGGGGQGFQGLGGGGGLAGRGNPLARLTPHAATPRQVMGMPQQQFNTGSAGRSRYSDAEMSPAVRRPAAPEISTVRSPAISAFSLGHHDEYGGQQAQQAQQALLHGGGEQRGRVNGKRMGWAAVTSMTNKPMASL